MHGMRRSRALLPAVVVTALGCAAASDARAEGFVDSLVRRFGESEFIFARLRSNAPMLPLAWVSGATYNDTRFSLPGGGASASRFEQTSFSEGAFLPIPIGKRDALVLGEWVGNTKFRAKESSGRDLSVLSVGIPIGWGRQVSPDWQVAAFVAPYGHTAHHDSWYWETLGGIFARYLPDERVSWVLGAYLDVSPLEDFYTPYLGATFFISERWTVNAIMPWPGVTYAPNENLLFRLGVTPSGASWEAEVGNERPKASFSAWNIGLGAEWRVYRNFWFGGEVGVSGIRGFSLVGSNWESADSELDSTGYALLTFNFRPGSIPGK